MHSNMHSNDSKITVNDFIGELSPGVSLGELRLTPTRSQVFMFSAVTWNRHRIHFDKEQAAAEGFPDVAVQRGLLGNYLVQLVGAWAGKPARIQRLHWRVIRSAFPEQELRCQGIVTDVAKLRDITRVDCALRILNPKYEQVAVGDARVRFESYSTNGRS